MLNNQAVSVVLNDGEMFCVAQVFLVAWESIYYRDLRQANHREADLEMGILNL